MKLNLASSPPVTEDLLREVVRRILSVGSPRKIILFGSHARGDAHAGSDLDILIIEPSDLPRFARGMPYLRSLSGLYPAKDVVVWTPDEVDEWSNVANHFVTEAIRDGRVLYEN